MSEQPWWWPDRTDEAWCREVRKEYPEMAHESDEYLRFYFTGDYEGEWHWTWDHLGDAKEQAEEMAAFLTAQFPDGPPSESEKNELRAKLRDLALKMDDAGMDALTAEEIEALVTRMSEPLMARVGKHLQRVADHLNRATP